MSAETIEAEFRPLATTQNAAPAAWVPTFAVAVDEAVERVQAKHDFFKRVMREGDHYGAIPGAGDRKVLLKPGAELLLANMGLRTELTDADEPTIDYGGDGREGLIRYRRVCRVYRQTGPHVEDREIVAQAEGSCSSREAKYRWRNAKRVCPECGVAAIIKGKEEYGGGFVCFKKQDGCGAKFRDNDERITSQAVGKVPNPDLADVENTILKMADKRALVAAALLATGCSDIFTQDVGDYDDPEPSGDRAEQRVTPSTPPEARNEAASVSKVGAPDPDTVPGSITEAAMKKLAEAFALWQMDARDIGASFDGITKGRVTDPDAMKSLSLNEARALFKSLSDYHCPACERRILKGEKHVGACPEDPANALAAYAEENLPL